MAPPTAVQRKNTAPVRSLEEAMLEQINNLTLTVRAFADKLDGDDDGDSDYADTLTESTVPTAPRIIEPTP